MNLILVGTNHKYSPIEIRERLFFSKKRLSEALSHLVNYPGIRSVVILSTCNRVELYASIQDIEVGISSLKKFLSDYHCQVPHEIEPYLYAYTGKEAVTHLFSVSCGIDSQIVGEHQILEQVRFVFDEAKGVGYIDNILNTVFSYALKVGERARAETGISHGDISIGSITLDFVREKLGTLKNKKILIIGVGKISESVMRCLKEECTQTIFIANRTFEKTKKLAKESGGIALHFNQLKEKLKEADVVISATGSPHFILRKEDILEAISHQPSAINHRLLIIDLAMPRNVQPEIKSINGIELYCLDELMHILEKTLAPRREQIPKVLNIIKEEVENLWSLIEPLESEHAEVPLP